MHLLLELHFWLKKMSLIIGVLWCFTLNGNLEKVVFETVSPHYDSKTNL